MPTLTPDVNSFIDTAAASDKTTRIVTSPFARIQVITTATSVDVTIYSDISAFTDLSKVGVYVDGAYNQQISATAGSTTTTITLPAGAKTVDFVNGPTSTTTGSNSDADLATCKGAWITNLVFNAAFTQQFPARTPKVLWMGDSITVGDGSYEGPTGPVHQKACSMQVRLAYAGQLALEGWGGGALFDYAGDSTKRARSIDLINIHNPSIIWDAFGHNDYFLSRWANANAYGTACGQLWDDIHAALPNAIIIAQTPVVRGDTAFHTDAALQVYRNAKQAAAATRTSFVRFVDGTPILSLSTDYVADEIHPNGAGHTKIANFVLPYLQGLSPTDSEIVDTPPGGHTKKKDKDHRVPRFWPIEAPAPQPEPKKQSEAKIVAKGVPIPKAPVRVSRPVLTIPKPKAMRADQLEKLAKSNLDAKIIQGERMRLIIQSDDDWFMNN